VALLRFALPPSLGTDRLVDHTRALREGLTDLLATEVDVTVSQSYASLARNLLSGAVDAAHAPPFVCAQVEPQGVTIVARAVRHGRATYGAALVKRKGSDTSLLRPKSIRAAWVDPHSVAGYLLALAHLKSTRRIDPVRHFAEQTFFGSYPAALAAVLDGRADLCAIHAQKGLPETIVEAAKQHAPGREGEVELVEMTAEVPCDGIAVSNVSNADAVRQAFLHLHKEAAGQRLLSSLFAAEKFESAPSNGYRALYAVAPRDL
jgi:ABC-type phosphate/phosphonate transport system substrate-binding protein